MKAPPEGESFRNYAKYDPSKFCDELRNVDWNVNEYSHVIIYTKKLLNSDWLRKECGSPVTRVQIIIIIIILLLIARKLTFEYDQMRVTSKRKECKNVTRMQTGNTSANYKWVLIG